MPDFHEAAGKDMLKKAPDELKGIDGDVSRTVAPRFAIGKSDVSPQGIDNTVVGDGYPKDVRGKILERSFGIADRLAIDIPGDLPGLGIDEWHHAVFLHLRFEFGLEDFGQSPNREIEVVAGDKPFFSVL